MTIEMILENSKLLKFETEILLASVLNQDRSFLNAFSETVLSKLQERKIDNFIKRRSKGEPIPYVLGYKEFFGLKFVVNKNVLIPRPETESLVTEVLDFVKENKLHNPIVVDVGTGSGAIAISLATIDPNLKIIATDLSSKALEIAKKNAKLCHVEAQIKFSESNLLTKVNDKIDIIAANLPYIPTTNWEKLSKEIKDFEPKEALDSGKSAMELYKTLFNQAKNKLKPNGQIFYELDGDIIQVSVDDLAETPQE